MSPTINLASEATNNNKNSTSEQADDGLLLNRWHHIIKLGYRRYSSYILQKQDLTVIIDRPLATHYLGPRVLNA